MILQLLVFIRICVWAKYLKMGQNIENWDKILKIGSIGYWDRVLRQLGLCQLWTAYFNCFIILIILLGSSKLEV